MRAVLFRIFKKPVCYVMTLQYRGARLMFVNAAGFISGSRPTILVTF